MSLARIPTCARKPAGGPPPVAVAEAARELGASVASLYRWIDQGRVPAERAGPGPPLKLRLDETVRAKFRDTVPDGYVSATDALRVLGVSRQPLWSRIQKGTVQALRVVRSAEKGLYVLLEASEQLPLTGLETATDD